MKTISFQKSNYVNVYADGRFEIVTNRIGIYQCFPAVDGCACGSAGISVRSAGGKITAIYKDPKYTLTLTFKPGRDTLTISPKLSNIKGLKEIKTVSLFEKAQLVGFTDVLAHGYFSWDQSFLHPAGELEAAESYAASVIAGREDNLVLGYLEHDKMMQSFVYQTEGNQTQISGHVDLEGKDLRKIKEVSFSDVVMFTDPAFDEGQKKWGRMVVKHNKVKLPKPPTRGWCSWYYNYFWFSGELIEEYMEGFNPYRKDLNLDVFVIDANYFSHLGDWLETNDKFPKGLEYYAKLIKKSGYRPGLWIGPWMVGDRSKLFQEHPDWLCRDENGELIEFMSPLGEDNVWGYRDKIHYCLDTSHPKAFEYLRNCFRTLRKWGFTYFKTDFMYWGAMDYFEGGWYHEGLNAHNFITDKAERPKIKRYKPGKTRVEYFMDVVKMIRQEAGPESVVLGCGQPIWMSIGYVDCMRISRDVGARWRAHNSPQQLLNDLQYRNFTNNLFYEIDPDCVLLRHFEHKLTDDEVNSLALLMGVSQGMVLTSDPVHKCKPARHELFKFIQADNKKIDFVRPLLSKEQEIIVYVGHRKDSDLKVLFCFNAQEVPAEKTLCLQSMGLPAKLNLCEWKKEGKVSKVQDTLKVSLKAHQSKLFFLQEKAFKKSFKPAKISG